MRARFGTILKVLRIERGWTQSDVELKTRIKYSTLSDIETGKTPMPRYETKARIASAFGMEVEDFLKQGDRADIIAADSLDKTAMKYLDDTILWALKPENRPYIDWIYEKSKKIHVDELVNLRTSLDI
jgi:transcriptional regulator with XRE-family HTH domain